MNQYFQNGCARAEKEIQNKLQNTWSPVNTWTKIVADRERDLQEAKTSKGLYFMGVQITPKMAQDAVDAAKRQLQIYKEKEKSK